MEKEFYEQLFNTTKEELAQTIKTLREEAQFTQETLEDKSGVTSRSISDIENAIVDVKLSTLVKIAYGLNIPLADLFTKVAKK